MKKNISFVIICFLIANLYAQDTSNTLQKVEFQYNLHKNPTRALFLSTLLPGSGQIYNESYYKAPIIWGGIAFFGYYFNFYNNRYDDYNKLYQIKLSENAANASSYARIRDFYFKKRDEMAVYVLIIYLANIVDAYVDAHMYDFKIIENQPIHISAQKDNQINFSRVSFGIKIPF
jgi:hypothetical protein